jgi:RNA polymerase sigma factor (sigma-70 family)
MTRVTERFCDHPPLTPEQQQMVSENYGLVGWAVKHFWCYSQRLGVNEATSVCHDALIHAVVLYDPTRSKFSTYASTVLWSWLKRESERAGVVRRKSGGSHGHPPIKIVSLDDVDQSLAAGDLGLEQMAKTEELEAVDNLIKHLSDRQKKVVKMLFADGLSSAEVGRALSISRERVRQIREDALYKMRCLLREAGHAAID